MGLGLLLSGLSGAGQATEASLADNQKLYDEQALNQQRSDLDVQKAMLIAQANKNMQIGLINQMATNSGENPPFSAIPLSPSAPATSAAPTSDGTSSSASPAAPVATSSPPPVSGLDMSKVTPQQLAALKKDPDFKEGVTNGVLDFNATSRANGLPLPDMSKMTPAQQKAMLPAMQADASKLYAQKGEQNNGDAEAVAPSQQNASSTSPQQPVSTAPQPWTPSPRLMLEVMKANLINPGSGDKILEANAPDATGKMLLQQGIMPGSQAWNDGYKAALFKATAVDMRPGQTISVDGKPVMTTPDADGNQVVYDANGTPNVVRVAGANKAATDAAAAKLAGTNSQTVASPEMSRRDSAGRIIPTTNAQLVDMSNQSGAAVGLAPGQDKGATLSQDEMSAKATDLATQNRAAQSTIANLQNMKALAAQAAVGGASDKLNYINHILATYGFQGANDLATANDLLNKNTAQIVAKQGAGKTDAINAIIASANPNSHMTPDAINDAADQLIGAQQMVQAKARLLAPSVAARDPVSYQKIETLFDQVADPRIFQYAGMNPQQQAAYVQKLPPDQINQLAQKRQLLRQMGVM